MSDRIDTRARRLVDLKDRYQRLKVEFEAAERAYREEEKELWHDLESDMGKVKTVTLDLGEGYGTIQLQRRETITSTILNADALADALEEMGLGDAVLGARQVRKRVLNEYVRDWLASGQPLPDGADFHARRYITVTRKDK